MTRAKLTLSMIVKNEGNRYLRQALEAHKDFIDAAVIIDDGSIDHTVDLCREVLKGIPLQLVQNATSQFSNEVALRKQQWQETIQTEPEWILNLDADEIMDSAFPSNVSDILEQQTYEAIYFRLYDMWSETHYREDVYWKAHHYYRPFMIKYRPDFPYIWRETPQHCGRFPLSINQFPYLCHPSRVKHFGWARLEDRQSKYNRYQLLDPDARYGWKEQYESILDQHPNLLEWVE
ncbi:glycosyltransferase family 2 protein [Brevibacillus sp. HB1.4B]|uniref:glycosyltransferase family 2 protein n=1 Tax=unclassified Brevibacillus TaxID=2684853 RepID=UPI00156BC978|nr:MULTISPECIES: glycosyltransferase family 2 protein [unclassified Brevibacillus]NRS18714.1 glycosyltransferase family 2 protein [Brevibacillus sp. HB1.4B]NTU33827.1 glycosyl transferase family 2 [Brevibacillus sp. HB1.1]